MKRDNSYYRYQRKRNIGRKYGILVRIFGKEVADSGFGKCKGTLSKGKIHCSCPMCKPKTKNYLKISERKKLLRDQQKFNNYEEQLLVYKRKEELWQDMNNKEVF